MYTPSPIVPVEIVSLAFIFLLVEIGRLIRVIRLQQVAREEIPDLLKKIVMITIVLISGIVASLKMDRTIVYEGTAIEILGTGLLGVLFFSGREDVEANRRQREMMREIRELRAQITAWQESQNEG